jgi:GDP/UDP-N,N'-diacetylbacillosamine 2-epimerase (hydrolysing)
MKKVCLVTGTRAEYGLLKNLIEILDQSNKFDLQLVVTGAHLSIKHGYTLHEIERDGFKISGKVDLNLAKDSPDDLAQSTAIGITGFSKLFLELKPDLLIILGDRYELLAVAISAMFHRIPIAHIHGGEVTEGAIDDAIRHAITKFSHLHFVGNQEYEKRVVQLGENPQRVFNVGGLGVDAIKNAQLLSRDALEEKLGINFKNKNLLITFHPTTLDEESSEKQMSELLKALEGQGDTCLIFTRPNADMGNEVICRLIDDFVANKPNAYVFTSLGQLLYLSCLQHVDAVIGNSSSGLTEMPTFKKATINIGNRQKGRLKSSSVINCKPLAVEIKNAISKSYTDEFRTGLRNVKNPYGAGGASRKILDVLDQIDISKLLVKSFYDI